MNTRLSGGFPCFACLKRNARGAPGAIPPHGTKGTTQASDTAEAAGGRAVREAVRPNYSKMRSFFAYRARHGYDRFSILALGTPDFAVGRPILCKEPADGIGNRPYPPITGAGATAHGALRGPLAVRTHESVQISAS